MIKTLIMEAAILKYIFLSPHVSLKQINLKRSYLESYDPVSILMLKIKGFNILYQKMKVNYL